MSSTGEQPPPPSTSMGPPPQPSTSGAPLNVQTNTMPPPQHPGAMQSPHPGPSSQPDQRYPPYPYGGKPMAMQQRPPQPWPEGNQEGHYPQYGGPVYGGQPYWTHQQPRYMPPQQYPGYHSYYPPMQPSSGQPQGEWRMPPSGQHPGYPQQPPPAPVQNQPPPPASNQSVAAALQSPGAASSLGQDDSMDDTKSVRSTSSVPPPQTPQRTSAATPGSSKQKESKSENTPSSKHPPPYNRQEVLEKLLPTNVPIEPELMQQRKQFFEAILSLAEQTGEPMTAAPQVSKTPIDLHRLYKACTERGGFEQVTKDKAWKNLCIHANEEMSESSAAGYQLRRHYQKYILQYECMITGRNHDELVAFAEKQKKKKKEKEPVNTASGSSTPAPGGQPPQGVPPMAQPPPQGFPPHAAGPPQPGPSFPPVDANGQPLPPYNGPYGYPGGPPGPWGPPPPPGYPPHYQRFPMPGPRPPMDQTAFEDHQRQQMHFPQQSMPQGPVRPPAPPQPSTPQPPQSQTQPQQESATNSSRAPSAAPPPSNPPPATSETAPQNPPPGPQPATSQNPQQGNPNDAPQSMPNQMGQPPMPYYPPSMPMYMARPPGQMYPQSHGAPPNGFQPPNSEQGQMPPYQGQVPPYQGQIQGHPSMYPPVMMRPPAPPGSFPNQQQDYWQRQAQQQAASMPRKQFVPPNQQQPQPSPGQQRPPVGPPQPVPPNQPPQQINRPQKGQPPMAAVAGPPVPYQPPQQQPHHPMMHPQSHVFPPGSVESIPQHFLGPQRRCIKKTTRDLIGVNPRRLLMSLRSDKHMESIWALNALTVMLYDESINPIGLSPELLCLVMEHFQASLSLVFPKVFALDEVKYSEEFSPSSPDTDFWTEVVESAKKCGDDVQLKVKLPVPKSSGSKVVDLNSFTKTGMKVVVQDSEMPRRLKRWRPSWSKDEVKSREGSMTKEERNKKGLPSEFASRLAAATKAAVEEQWWGRDELKYSVYCDDRRKHLEYDDDIQPKPVRAGLEGAEDGESKMEVDGEMTKTEGLVYDRDAPLDCSLVPRPIGLNLIPQTIEDYAGICLAWSNVIRGFAFNPANEPVLAAHHGLLKTIGTLLMLYVQHEGQPKFLSRRRKQELNEKEGKTVLEETTAEEDAAAKKEEEKKRAAMVATEKDEMKSFLLDVANQLRDDAFTVLSVVAGSLDMFNLDSEISYPIFDALIHWVVSHSILAKDPLVPWGSISPKNFCLEILGKMTVNERNIDLLLSTGSWERLEEFIKVVSGLIHMGEETHIREFALVIMNAVCQASELACIVAGTETDIIKNTITFMEVTDTTMFQVVSQHGMHFLRENQDVIGTTFGMLRRAGNLLNSIVEKEECRKTFLKNIGNLMNLTLSHYMDTRVALMVATIMHTAYQANVDNETGKSLDVPDTPSVEPQILFPGKYSIPNLNRKDDNSRDDRPQSSQGKGETMEEDRSVNGIKSSDTSHMKFPSTSTTQFQLIENGSYSNGVNGHEGEIKTFTNHINGSKNVKAILRDSIHNKQHDDPVPSKKPRHEINGNGIQRINGSSPSASQSNSGNGSSSSTMAIVT